MNRIRVYIILLFVFNLLIGIVGLSFNLYNKYYIAPTPIVSDIFIDEENFVKINFKLNNTSRRNKIYFLYKTDNTIPKIDDINWKLTKHNNCSFKLDDNIYYAFFKNEDNKILEIKEVSTLGKITEFTFNKDKIYLPLNDSYKPNLTIKTIGNVDTNVVWYSENEDIAAVDENKIIARKKGSTKVHAKIGNIDKSIDVLVTDLVVSRPKQYNKKKPYLPCGRYTKEENDLLDEILKDKINDAGYKTRAGAVEAARFLALDFPYKIRYFSENGRADTNKIDGEGRYYHIGLYLHSSRYANIKNRMHGPKTWGCSMYCRPSKGYRSNGFDCSGFVSWVLLNGGFDVGDIGAGITHRKDLTDYGKRTRFSYDVVKSGKVKVGDLLSSGGISGGHIAIIVGEDDNYYYVAESLWTPPNVAVVIIPYSKKNLFKRYFYVMLMDDYYKEDGNLTKMWY